MLATCVNMHSSQHYSLARMRHENPELPFWVGGELLVLEAHAFLRDALGGMSLKGNLQLSAVKTGDLVWVHVVERQDQILLCEDLKLAEQAHLERSPSRPHAGAFARFTEDVRRFFLNKGLQEILTPTLVPCPGLEPSLEPFVTEVTRGKARQTVYLPTSPEIHLKKALARGWTDIFEIRSCFRRGEFSDHHENEFTMLEWYRGFADLDLVIQDLCDLLATLSAWGSAPSRPPRVTDFAELFEQIFGFRLTPRTTCEELKGLAQRFNLDLHDSDTFTDIFHRLMIERIEPAMTKMGPLIVRRFPPEMAALAKLDRDGWADRFEFYWNGLEIANAFSEVTDPLEQGRRWQSEQQERQRLGTTPLPQDPELIDALKMGIPPTGGIALGIERLYMAIVEVRNIRELKHF